MQVIGFNKDLEKTQLLSGVLTPAADTFGKDRVGMVINNSSLKLRASDAGANIVLMNKDSSG